ncbi:MAG: sugar phosphate isomerase/epimerase [Lentisphaerae bacterium]|nr:sugar phosphate isomerase/epimerase [Lentisphaerota bacterium]
MDKKLFFNYPWANLAEPQYYSTVREFLDNNCRDFVINDTLLAELIGSDDKVVFLKKLCKDMDVSFGEVHGLGGKGYDINTREAELRARMIPDHIKAMQIAADFGCRTYTVHVGAAQYCYEHIPMDVLRPLALETLEKLLPAAEKCGIIIAVENSFELPNSAKEVMGLINHFGDHPNIGACYDTGHANCMASAPGKTLDKYEPYFAVCWWENGVIQEDFALETMRDRIVTCHIHDNDGYGDLHGMPFDGTINWQELMPKLLSCPKMVDYQTEVCYSSGENWAGKLLAPVGGYSIRKMADTFHRLFSTEMK